MIYGRKPGAAGRPYGRESTRSVILTSARKMFAEVGYASASIRAIAREAGVDHSTLMHFFGTKEALFQAVVGDLAKAMNPVIEELRNGTCGRDIARSYLEVWDHQEAGAAMKAVVRSAFQEEQVMVLFRASLNDAILCAQSTTRDRLDAELLVSQFMTLGMARYIFQLPELSGAEVETIANRVAPILDAWRTISVDERSVPI